MRTPGITASGRTGLTWAKIDWDEGFIHLAAADTKERKPKKIPISPMLRTVLQDIRKDQREGTVAADTSGPAHPVQRSRYADAVSADGR